MSSIKIEKNFPAEKISWFRVGGKVKKFALADSLDTLKELILNNKNEKIYIIGAGSNLLIRDSGFDGLLIKLGHEFLNIKLIDKNTIQSGCGVSSAKLAKFAAESEISGFEFLYTIPGTVGGNIRMNAGCYNSEIQNIIQSVSYFDINSLEIKTINLNIQNFEYRKILLPESFIFLSAEFKGSINNKSEILSKMEEMIQKRNLTQPILTKTCGSTFKNPKNSNLKAWEIIDKIGMRGYVIGGVKFSEKHANFLVNFNNGTASDIEELILLAIKKAKKDLNIDLEVEIKII